MAELFSDFFQWMDSLPPLWAYVALLVIAYGENVLPPVPGDMAIVFGGYLVGIGRLDFALVLLLATLGGTLGFMTMYAIGYRIGDAVMDPGRLRWLPKDQIGRAQHWLGRWGYGVIAANRFLSGLRSVISLTVGMAKMPAGKTAFWATLSALVWTGLITYAGYAAGQNWEAVSGYLRIYGKVMIGLMTGLLLLFVLHKIWKRRQQGESGSRGVGESGKV